MHIQPQSDQLRKYIPAYEYFLLMTKQRKLSLTNQSLDAVDRGVIDRRIKDLERLEAKGFVYIGEKNWLQTFLQEGKASPFNHYGNWVKQNLQTHLGLKFQLSTDFPHLDYPIWQAEMDATSLTLDFNQLKNPAFLEIDELEVFVCGDEKGPHDSHLVKAFEFLHNLEYAMSTVAYRPQGGREISVTGIEVSDPKNPEHWELNVISDYGSDWDFTIINGVAKTH